MRPDELNFIELLNKAQIQINPDQSLKLFTYLNNLLSVNQTTNITAITDYGEALTKHLYDSLQIINQPIFKKSWKIMDVGSGGGLPGIPLAICNPEKNFVSLEATRKKVMFQQEICNEMEIKNISIIWGRSEELAHNSAHRENYDLVLARALAPTNTLAELTLPFVKVGSYTIYYKAKEYLNELQTAEPAINLLGGSIDDIIKLNLPENQGIRNLVVIKKIKSTSLKYPRRPGLPQKSPLK